MYTHYLDFLKQRFPTGNPHSMSPDEIKFYENQLNVKFAPVLYEFYSIIGKGYGELGDWDISGIQNVKDVIDWVRSANLDDDDFYPNLDPDNILVIGSYDADLVFIYKSDLTMDDPPVYVFLQQGYKGNGYSPDSIVKWNEHFSVYIRNLFMNYFLARGL